MAGGNELFELIRALLEKEEMERKERCWPLGERGVDNLATPPTAEQRGDALDGHARLRERRCHYCEPCVTGRNREKEGESMTCGVHM